jgi:hypothetical protein
LSCQGHSDVSALTVLTIEVWDYVPTLLLLTTLGASPINRTSAVPPKHSSGNSAGSALRIGISGLTGLFSATDEEDEDNVSLVNDLENSGRWRNPSYQHSSPSLNSPSIGTDAMGFERYTAQLSTLLTH